MTVDSPATTATPSVRVRFAPSPTGDLHIGGARSALFTWLFARQRAGAFVLRIEDTDQKRLKDESVDAIFAALHWLGLDWDEGPDVGGPLGPYTQSERLPRYQQHARQLVASGHAYECFCAPERLAALRAQQVANKQPPGYDRHCRTLIEAERAVQRAAGVTPVVRLAVPLDGVTVVRDELRGESRYENRLLEDVVLLKSDGFPTYHLAVVVDDHAMQISDVMRGEEWLPSAPVHVLVYQAFGWELPSFYHMPVILNPDGKGKLSKRHGSVSVLAYRDEGYLAEALVNYMALVGWSFDDHEEFFSLGELREKFSFKRVNPSPARYNPEKLLWFNQHYINHVIELDDLTHRCWPWLRDAGLVSGAPHESPQWPTALAAVALIKDKMKLLSEAPALTSFFFGPPDTYDAELLVPKKVEPAQTRAALERSRAIIAEQGVDDEAALETQLRALGEELGLKAGQLFMPIRVALTGRTVSPGLFGTLRVIGRDAALARLDAAVAKLAGA